MGYVILIFQIRCKRCNQAVKKLSSDPLFIFIIMLTLNSGLSAENDPFQMRHSFFYTSDYEELDVYLE